MAGIDILNQFPNSKMAAAAHLGQSYFRSEEATTITTAPVLKSGSVSQTGVTGTTSTAQLLTLCGLTSSFSYIMFTITTSVAGVPISQGGTSIRYLQGQTATFTEVSTSQNQVTLGPTVAGDVVAVNYLGS